MKENSKKLLLALYPVDTHFFQAPQEILSVVLPELSADGKRSLLYYLEKKQYLDVLKISNTTTIALTQKGVEAVEALFPALHEENRSWQGEWQCIVFKTAPKGDAQFRYLRTRVISEGAVTLARGVYCIPRSFSAELVSTLNSIYSNSVVMFSIKDWLLGSQRPIAISDFGVEDVVNGYSSISKQVSQLLGKRSEEKRLSSKSKEQLSQIFNRFYAVIREDKGLGTFYFPHEKPGQIVLKEIQQAFTKLQRLLSHLKTEEKAQCFSLFLKIQ